MKRVLLVGVNAKYIHSNPAIYSLEAYARAHINRELADGALELVEYTINQNIENILADIYRRKPDIAAFSCYIWNWNMIQDILTELPKVLPDIKIWLGGPEVSFHGEQILERFGAVQGIVLGEGEITFTELFSYYQWDEECGKTLESIGGLLLRSGRTGAQKPVEMDELPFFYEESEGNNNSGLERFENRILYYESQRGCPFSCAYCLSSIDKTVRFRSLERIKEHMQFFLEQRVQQVKFIDRTFNCNAKHALEVWKYLKENDNGVTNFHFEIAADLLTKEQLEVMADMRPGLIQLEIGVQSTNKQTLQAIHRDMGMSHLREIVEKVHSFGNVHQHLDLIAGLPYEDYVSFGKSFDDVYAMNPQQLQLGFLKVLKGSPMEEKATEYGIIYNSKSPYEVLYSKWLSYEDVLRLKGIEEMVELYYNSNQFVHTIRVLETEFSSAFKMYEALAAFYEENGYAVHTPARAYRYQVLLDFACKINPTKRELYVELLTFDLYLRENLKSRPAFCPVLNPTKEDGIQVKEFYQNEAQNPRFLTHYKGYQGAQLMKMTHLEAFYYAVWSKELQECTNRLEKPVYVLFDYQSRDALTHDARFVVIGECLEDCQVAN